MRLIDADRLKDVPMFNGKYDKENANEHFIMGIETVIEFINELPTIPYDMKWNPNCEDCLPEGIDDCIECHKQMEGRWIKISRKVGEVK